MGLAQNVDDTAKAFQGNPQALQQRYTQKKDLFDLLALNMIKKQQAEAKNALTMSQEKKPGTIIEQMEKELVGNAKTEMGGNTQAETASGVAGALQEKQKDSQQNMQQVANTGVAATPQGGMMKLAGGGIVGFAAGGQVTAEILKKINISRKDFESLPKETQDTLVSSIAASVGDDDSQLSSDIDSFLGPKERRRILQTAADKATLNAPGFFSQAGEYIFGDKESYKDVTDKKNAAEERKKYLTNLANTDKPQFNEPGGPGTSFNPIAGAGGGVSRDQNSLSGIAAVTPEVVTGKKVDTVNPTNETKIPSVGAPEVTSSDKKNLGIEDIAYGGIKVPEGVQNIDKQTQEGITSLLTENKDRTAFTNEMMGDRRKLREEMEGKLKGRGLKEFLLGARGNTLGQTLRSGASASLAADKEADALLRGEFGDINKLGMDEFNKLADLKEKGVTQGRQYSKDEKVIAQNEAGQKYDADKTNQSMELEADKLLQDISDSKVKNEIQKGANKLKAQTNSILAQGNTIKSNSDMIRLYEGEETKHIKSLETNAANALNLIFGEDKEAKDKRNKIRAGLAANIKKFTESYAAKRKKYEVNLASLTTAKTGGISEVDKILGIK